MTHRKESQFWIHLPQNPCLQTASLLYTRPAPKSATVAYSFTKRDAAHMSDYATYWKLSILLCRGFILNEVALFDSLYTALSSWAAACLRALSWSSRALRRKDEDWTGLLAGSLVPLKQRIITSFEMSCYNFKFSNPLR